MKYKDMFKSCIEAVKVFAHKNLVWLLSLVVALIIMLIITLVIISTFASSLQRTAVEIDALNNKINSLSNNNAKYLSEIRKLKDRNSELSESADKLSKQVSEYGRIIDRYDLPNDYTVAIDPSLPKSLVDMLKRHFAVKTESERQRDILKGENCYYRSDTFDFREKTIVAINGGVDSYSGLIEMAWLYEDGEFGGTGGGYLYVRKVNGRWHIWDYH